MPEAKQNVHYLSGFNNAVILTLEHALEKARAGEIESLFIAGILKNTDVISCSIVDEDADVFKLIGRIESAKIELVISETVGLTQDVGFGQE